MRNESAFFHKTRNDGTAHVSCADETYCTAHRNNSFQQLFFTAIVIIAQSYVNCKEKIKILSKNYVNNGNVLPKTYFSLFIAF